MPFSFIMSFQKLRHQAASRAFHAGLRPYAPLSTHRASLVNNSVRVLDAINPLSYVLCTISHLSSSGESGEKDNKGEDPTHFEVRAHSIGAASGGSPVQ